MKWFYNMKIASKLIAGFILVALIAGIIGFIGVTNIQSIDNSSDFMYVNITRPISELSAISTAFQRTRISIRDMIYASEPDKIAEYEQKIKDRKAEIVLSVAEFEKVPLDPEMRKVYKDLSDARADYLPNLDKAIELARANRDSDAYVLLYGAMDTASLNEQAAILKLTNLLVSAAQKRSNDNSAQANASVFIMIAGIAIGMLLAVGLGIFISRALSKPVKELVGISEKIADGDLDIDISINTKDEIGILASSFKKMSVNLNEVMSNINNAAQQVAEGSKQVSDSAQALSQGATEQASSIEQLTASLEEISSQTKLNADNASQASGLSENARTNAVDGNSQMKEMLKAMGEINESSGNISKIIKVIDDIAFQTNILALNAAVEAARAGQHGKGFAVVAEEVRNLAARSASAARETTEMIEGSIKKVEAGTRIANQTADALNKIVEEVSKASSLVGGIAVASGEQASAIAQINQGIMQVSEVVQTNSATSEESAAASEELASQAQVMQEQISRFKLKKSQNASLTYNGLGDLHPEVLQILQKLNSKNAPGKSVNRNESSSTAPKIVLNDKEFGKY